MVHKQVFFVKGTNFSGIVRKIDKFHKCPVLRSKFNEEAEILMNSVGKGELKFETSNLMMNEIVNASGREWREREVIPSHLQKENSYIEKDEQLLCESA